MIYLLSDHFLLQKSHKPTLKHRPGCITIHCGTNDLKNNAPQLIADNVLSLAKSKKQENRIAFVSSIVHRKDNLY